MAESTTSYQAIPIHSYHLSPTMGPASFSFITTCQLRVFFSVLLIDAFAFGLWISVMDSLSDFSSAPYLQLTFRLTMAACLLSFTVCGLAYLDVEWLSGLLLSRLFLIRIMSVFPATVFCVWLALAAGETLFVGGIHWNSGTGMLVASEGIAASANMVLCDLTKLLVISRGEDEDCCDIPSFDPSHVIAIHV